MTHLDVKQSGHVVYILANLRRTVLYVGVTKNLSRRLAQHRSGNGAVFTRRYHADQLVYVEEYCDATAAKAREAQLKAGSRRRKEALIEQANPGWVNLIP